MVVSCDRIPQTFAYTGTVLALDYKDNGTIKGLRLSHPLGGLPVKLDKTLRTQLPAGLSPGAMVQVSGYQKPGKYGMSKFTADRLILQAQGNTESSMPAPAAPRPPRGTEKSDRSPTKATILVCGKSGCRKRGSAKLCSAIESAMGDRSTPSHVCVKEVGCMKQCKAGPHLVFMPDKARYSQVKPQDVPRLLAQHIVRSANDSVSDVQRAM
jgi:(2Fe-2S) ferredoxin